MTVTTVELKLTRQYKSEIPPTPPQIQARVSTLLRIGLLHGLPFLTVACEEEKVLRSSVREKYSLNPLILLSTFNPITTNKSTVMAGLAPEGSQYDSRQYRNKMNELLSEEGKDFFTSYDQVFDAFDKMGLTENLLRGIYAYDFEKPSAIQQRGIVPFCKGLDVIQQAQPGLCSGGSNDPCCWCPRCCWDPGRVFDMLRRQSLHADNIRMFVLDEADEMLSRDFKDQTFSLSDL
ncbi:hypothetical protein SLE2022_037560 [Rubroshorea leprosula]